LAESGHYPAIDVEASASRVMHNVATPAHLELARKFRGNYSRYMRSRDLIQLGAYAAGSDPEVDRAIVLYPGLQRFLLQDMHDASTLSDSLHQLAVALQEESPSKETGRKPSKRPSNPYEKGAP
jgi:flagellum-specific ATP synthase